MNRALGAAMLGILWPACMVLAQGMGVQVAESTPGDEGDLRCTVGLNAGEASEFGSPGTDKQGSRFTYGGARIAYGVVDGARVFGELGFCDSGSDVLGGGLVLGAGVLCAVPVDVPGDYAVRLAFAKPFFGPVELDSSSGTGAGERDISVWAMSALLLAGAPLEGELEHIVVYGGAGCLRTSVEVESLGDNVELDPLLSCGIIYARSEDWSAFAEVDYIESVWFGGGIRFDI